MLRSQQHQGALKADTNASNTGLFKEVSASKVARYPLLMPPTLRTEP
jgi:hypothetical protein